MRQTLAHHHHVRKRACHGQAAVVHRIVQHNHARTCSPGHCGDHARVRIARYHQVRHLRVELERLSNQRNTLRGIARSRKRNAKILPPGDDRIFQVRQQLRAPAYCDLAPPSPLQQKAQRMADVIRRTRPDQQHRGPAFQRPPHPCILQKCADSLLIPQKKPKGGSPRIRLLRNLLRSKLQSTEFLFLQGELDQAC